MKALSLLYHDVVADGNMDSSGFPGEAAARYKMDRSDFERHMAAIAETNLFHAGARDGRFPEPHYLTIDDGGSSAVTVADIVERYGWRACFFVTAAYIDKPGFLFESQIRELHARGHVIGTHSYSHPERMACCSRDQLVDEWRRSADILSQILGTPVVSASVPGGFFSRQVAQAAASAGIRRLFTSEPVMRIHHAGPCEVCGRYTFWRGMSPEMAADIVAGRGAARWRQYGLWNAKKFAKVLGGSAYIRFKRWWLERGRS